jgi:hypothetical protein
VNEMEIGGIEILSFDPAVLRQTIADSALMEILQHNGLDLNRDWSNLGHHEAVRLLRQADGQWQEGHDLGNVPEASPGYVFSVDNFLKMLIIHTRLSVGIPVVIMGRCWLKCVRS